MCWGILWFEWCVWIGFGWSGSVVIRCWTINPEIRFDTRPGQDISETLCVSNPTRGELVWSPELASLVSVLYTGHVKEPRRSIQRRARGLCLDLLVSHSFSLRVRSIYAKSMEGPNSYKVIIIIEMGFKCTPVNHIHIIDRE